MNLSRDTLKAFTDAAADAVAREIATIRRVAVQERAQRDAEHSERLATLDARMAAVSELERRLEDRIADLKATDEAVIERLIAEAVAAIPPAEPGKDVDMAVVALSIASEVECVLAGWERPKDGLPPTSEEIEAAVEASVRTAIAALPPAEPGRDADPAVMREMVLVAVGDAVAALPPAEPGKDADPEVIREMVQRAVAGLPPAKDGAPGKLPVVREWEDRVYYEGDVVTRDGSTFQANRDTGRTPPHDDWTCLARAGRNGEDAKSPIVRGTWVEDASYGELDIVALNGAAFIARHADPGVCPGDGWQLISAQGKRGKPGEDGKRTTQTKVVAESVVAMTVNTEGLLTLVNSDGSTVDCDLYPVLNQLRQ